MPVEKKLLKYVENQLVEGKTMLEIEEDLKANQSLDEGRGCSTKMPRNMHSDSGGEAEVVKVLLFIHLLLA
jgi:hypothetical protein